MSDLTFQVVVNDEEQYSVWRVDKPTPVGWRDGGFSGTRDQCLDFIETVWTDLRPKSLRLWLAEVGARAPMPPSDLTEEAPLPIRLASEPQRVELRLAPGETPMALFATGVAWLRFTETRGGTELCFELSAPVATSADSWQLRGATVLDGFKLQVDATIEIATLRGVARMTASPVAD